LASHVELIWALTPLLEAIDITTWIVFILDFGIKFLLLSNSLTWRGDDKRISKVVQAPGFIRGINPFSKIENPQAPAFIRGVNLKSKI
jgi:hypothetical protein